MLMRRIRVLLLAGTLLPLLFCAAESPQGERAFAAMNDPTLSEDLSDPELKVAVENALIWNEEVDLTGVTVRTAHGVVTLIGTVDSARARQAAANAAFAAGAVAVRNLLRIGPP